MSDEMKAFLREMRAAFEGWNTGVFSSEDAWIKAALAWDSVPESERPAYGD